MPASPSSEEQYAWDQANPESNSPPRHVSSRPPERPYRCLLAFLPGLTRDTLCDLICGAAQRRYHPPANYLLVLRAALYHAGFHSFRIFASVPELRATIAERLLPEITEGDRSLPCLKTVERGMRYWSKRVLRKIPESELLDGPGEHEAESRGIEKKSHFPVNHYDLSPLSFLLGFDIQNILFEFVAGGQLIEDPDAKKDPDEPGGIRPDAGPQGTPRPHPTTSEKPPVNNDDFPDPFADKSPSTSNPSPSPAPSECIYSETSHTSCDVHNISNTPPIPGAEKGSSGELESPPQIKRSHTHEAQAKHQGKGAFQELQRLAGQYRLQQTEDKGGRGFEGPGLNDLLRSILKEKKGDATESAKALVELIHYVRYRENKTGDRKGAGYFLTTWEKTLGKYNDAGFEQDQERERAREAHVVSVASARNVQDSWKVKSAPGIGRAAPDSKPEPAPKGEVLTPPPPLSERVLPSPMSEAVPPLWSSFLEAARDQFPVAIYRGVLCLLSAHVEETDTAVSVTLSSSSGFLIDRARRQAEEIRKILTPLAGGKSVALDISMSALALDGKVET